MPEFKVVVSDPKTGKATNHEIKGPEAQSLMRLRIGDFLDASVLGLKGRLKITGGSDRSGFPMRRDVLGGVKKHVLLSGPPGIRTTKKGERIRKLVRGNLITDDIYQINAVLET